MANLTATAAERLLAARRRNKKPPFDITTFLFKEQLEFAYDEEKFVTAVCSVRAGKTTACAADLVHTCLASSGVIGLYITLARSSAKRIVWPELKKIIKGYDISANANNTELSITFSNNSVIYCTGANTEVEMEKLRGLSNVAVAYIDESQAFRSHIEELVDDVLIKRLYDLNGRLRLIGTPGPIPAGYFHDASQSRQWKHHHWTMHQNPWLLRKSGKTPEQLIQQDMDRKGVGIDDPSIQRECFGQWKLDRNSLLLNYNPEINHFDELPEGKYRYILGLDFGYEDSDSLSVLAFSEASPVTYLIEEVVKSKQTYEQLRDEIDRLNKAYPFSKMMADPGGGGKKLIESLRPRYRIPIEVADKQGKIANYGLLNNALRTGNFKANKNSTFAKDCNVLEKDRDLSTPERTVVKGHSDAVDSVLYAFKESPAYYYEPKPAPPAPGTVEHNAKVSEEIFNHTVQNMQREKESANGQGTTWTTDRNGIPGWLKFNE